MKIKIAFVDFWPGFIPENSYFFDLLGGTNKVELSESPEIIFFSNFGSEHKKYDCYRIFFSAENERANMYKCDIALTFDFNKNKNCNEDNKITSNCNENDYDYDSDMTIASINCGQNYL